MTCSSHNFLFNYFQKFQKTISQKINNFAKIQVLNLILLIMTIIFISILYKNILIKTRVMCKKKKTCYYIEKCVNPKNLLNFVYHNTVTDNIDNNPIDYSVVIN